MYANYTLNHLSNTCKTTYTTSDRSQQVKSLKTWGATCGNALHTILLQILASVPVHPPALATEQS